MRKKFEILRSPEGETGGGGESPAPAAAAPSPAPAPTGVVTGDAAPAPGAPPPAGGPPAPAPEAPAPLTPADIKLPEGYEAKPEQLTSLLAVLSDDKLSPADRASSLAKLHADMVADTQKQFALDWEKRQTEAANTLRNHPTMGGKALDASLATWNNVLTEFGTSELRAEIDRTGLGNSVEFGQFLLKIGTAFAEGKPVVGGPTSAARAVSAADILYPSTGKS